MRKEVDLRKEWDYSEGDLVQIVKGAHAGEVGRIEGITLNFNRTGLMYYVYINSGEYISLNGLCIRFLRHADDEE